MKKPETIQTLHPDPTKTNKNIAVEKYELVKAAMLQLLAEKQVTHVELMQEIAQRLEGKIEGNIGWYSETVKLDLEARQLIKRTNSKPQQYLLF